jgi:hypothetical protein
MQCIMKKKSNLKNITFSADAALIEKARRQANIDNITLNDAFRAWLEQFVRPIQSADEYKSFMHEFKGKLIGSRFIREEANER